MDQPIQKKDFLVEIGTEELPPKALSILSHALTKSIIDQLKDKGLSFDEPQSFATPRRLGLLLKGLSVIQPDQQIERKGPAVKAAFKDGEPTKALKGFVRACNADINKLETIATNKGKWLVYRSVQQGKQAVELLPSIVDKALNNLPVPKRMRWGVNRYEFVRPVHWLVMLLGEDVVECEFFGLKSGRATYGHRFHSSQALNINSPCDYESLLETKGKVIASFERRQSIIKNQAEQIVIPLKGKVLTEPELLDEVTGLVEWPVAITGKFNEQFLSVPKESLISSMQEHQKYFPVLDDRGSLLPFFVCISNIISKDLSQVISGNERVISPRLADAQFFYETDKKTTLEAKRNKLKDIIFQKQLGTIFDKTERMDELALSVIGQCVNHCSDKLKEQTSQVAMLSKSDLVSEMVLEFPKLQGIMGRYYAQAERLNANVCLGLEEQYLPRFSGDKLPVTDVGCAVAIAEKLDTIVGIFGIGQPPSGNKDPFGLRRSVLGVLRIAIEKKLPLQLDILVQESLNIYKWHGVVLPVKGVKNQIIEFIFERLRSLSQNEGFPAETYLSVKAVKPMSPYDFYLRMQAVENFRRLPEASTLAQANKRVSNILVKAKDVSVFGTINANLLHEIAEKALFNALEDKEKQIAPIKDYSKKLELLASLKEPVDKFFDHVLVNVEDEKLKNNRYALLAKLQAMFRQVADIGLM